MAMTINTEGLTEVSQMLERLGNQAEAVASGALYDGASVVADAMLPTSTTALMESSGHKSVPRTTA